MYREAFDGEPPITDDEVELDMSGYDPNHNYMADVDAMQPGWRVPGPSEGVTYMPPGGAFPSSAAFHVAAGLREVATVHKTPTGATDKAGRPKMKTTRVVHHLPSKPYVRWIDLAGNLGPLIVSTIRPDAAAPSGDDNLGTMSRIIALKQRRGGIVVEGDNYRTPWAPNYVGNQYVYWALQVMKHRKALHAANQEEERATQEDEWRRKSREQNTENAAAIAGAMKEVIQEVRSEVRGRAPKAEKQP